MDVDGIGQYGAFEVPDLVQVLKECQRFYRKYGSGSTVYERLAVGVGLSTTQVNFIIDFNSSPMRSASYSGGLSNNSHFAGYDGSTLFTGTWALGDVAKGSCSLFLTTTGVTATNAYALVTNNTLDGYLFLNDRMS
jgi:hypothetical protein